MSVNYKTSKAMWRQSSMFQDTGQEKWIRMKRKQPFFSCVLQYFDVHTKYVYRVEDNALTHVFIL